MADYLRANGEVAVRAYAGIGSRKTPRPVIALIERMAKAMADDRWVLRTGHAPGADQAFERGAGHRAEVYLPWPKFEQTAPLLARTVVDSPTREAMEISATFHPAWEHLTRGARMLHARNAHQVLGLYLNDPVAQVLCWTPDGKGDGGTGQAIRIAEAYGVPVFDLGKPELLAKAEAHFA
jgi:hypothetical protein